MGASNIRTSMAASPRDGLCETSFVIGEAGRKLARHQIALADSLHKSRQILEDFAVVLLGI